MQTLEGWQVNCLSREDFLALTVGEGLKKRSPFILLVGFRLKVLLSFGLDSFHLKLSLITLGDATKLRSFFFNKFQHSLNTLKFLHHLLVKDPTLVGIFSSQELWHQAKGYPEIFGCGVWENVRWIVDKNKVLNLFLCQPRMFLFCPRRSAILYFFYEKCKVCLTLIFLLLMSESYLYLLFYSCFLVRWSHFTFLFLTNNIV